MESGQRHVVPILAEDYFHMLLSLNPEPHDLILVLLSHPHSEPSDLSGSVGNAVSNVTAGLCPNCRHILLMMYPTQCCSSPSEIPQEPTTSHPTINSSRSFNVPWSRRCSRDQIDRYTRSLSSLEPDSPPIEFVLPSRAPEPCLPTPTSITYILLRLPPTCGLYSHTLSTSWLPTSSSWSVSSPAID